MKLYLIVAVCVAVGLQADLAPAQGDEWELFKAKYNKSYATPQEEAQRRANFKASLRMIERHNSRASSYASALGSYTMALNDKADWSAEERAKLNGLRRQAITAEMRDLHALEAAEFLRKLRLEDPSPVPKAFDWRQVPSRVGRVKDQKQCGSCWAFATTGLLEGQQLQQHGKLIELSEQHLIDCSASNRGCDGGNVERALDDIAKMDGGLASERDYPYKFYNDVCSANESLAITNISGHITLLNITERDLAEVVFKFGPVAVSLDATDMMFYSNGVYSDPHCRRGFFTHGVLIVGYGTDPEQGDYWILKNSWGTNWGLRGFIHLRRGRNECNVLDDPVIVKFTPKFGH